MAICMARNIMAELYRVLFIFAKNSKIVFDLTVLKISSKDLTESKINKNSTI